jgi:antitoxin StbD
MVVFSPTVASMLEFAWRVAAHPAGRVPRDDMIARRRATCRPCAIRCIHRCTPSAMMAYMSPRVDEVLPTREARAKLPSLLAGFRARGAEADPVVIGAHRRPEAVVLSYERYLAMLSGRERVKAILADRRAAGPGMGEDEAMRVAVKEQHASRR